MKMKKLVAMLAAGILCLGMSTTAFAAISPNDPVGTDKDGNVIVKPNDKPLSVDEQEVLDYAIDHLRGDEAAVTLKNLGFDVPYNAEVIVIGTEDYVYTGEGNMKPGTEINFNLSAWAEGRNLRAGDQIILLHAVRKADGSIGFEKQLVTVKWDKDAKIFYATGKLDSLSPVSFIKVMQDGTLVRYNEDGEIVAKSSPKGTTVKVSPKTGE